MTEERFVFRDFRFKEITGEIFFDYQVVHAGETIDFEEVLQLPQAVVGHYQQLTMAQKDRVARVLFNLHLALGINYWKIFCLKEIRIETGKLTRAQADFWEKLYFKGLSQFYFENQLDPFLTAPKFPVTLGQEAELDLAKEKRIGAGKGFSITKNLLFWGGGKDSWVSAIILGKLGEDFALFNLRDSALQKMSAEKTGKERVVVEKKMAANFGEVQARAGAFRGHVPVTVINSWVAVLVAMIEGYERLILSNERSASEGNLVHQGLEVNHQYAKTFEMEQDFQDYLHRFIDPDLEYFSLLRGFYELKIAKIFAKNPHYFEYFSSCNANFKLDPKARLQAQRWCDKCPKCLFVFVMLAAFVSKRELLRIFGADLLAKEELGEMLADLLGWGKFKPLECVGTYGEVRLALTKIAKKKEFQGEVLVERFRAQLEANEAEILASEKEILSFHKEGNLIPEAWIKRGLARI